MFVDVVTPEVAPVLGLSEGSELVDRSVIDGAVNYLVRHQEESGRFPVIGHVHNYNLLVYRCIICMYSTQPLIYRCASS